MIHIIDDWYVDVDDYQYILKKDLHRTRIDKRTKKETEEYKIAGYYSSLSKALDGLGKKIILDDLQGVSTELAEACTHIREQTDRWKNLTKEIMEACGL